MELYQGVKDEYPKLLGVISSLVMFYFVIANPKYLSLFPFLHLLPSFFSFI